MRRKGTGFMVLGTLLILAAVLLTAYNLQESSHARRSSDEVVQLLEARLTPPAAAPEIPQAENPDISSRDQFIPEEPTAPSVPDYVLFPTKEMPTVRINGRDYIGTVSIPGLQLELPVISEWSYPALRVSPCRYKGSAYTNDLILMAHNYESHFGRIKNLRPGDFISFVDADGNQFCYEVVDMQILDGTAISAMTAGEWDLTLFTCTYGGQSRVTLRCELLS